MAKKEKADRKRKREETDAVGDAEPAVAGVSVVTEADAEQASVAAAADGSKKDKKKKKSSKQAEQPADGDTVAAVTEDAAADAAPEDEVEVLSHKEQRKRRRLEKRAASLAANADANATAAADGTPASGKQQPTAVQVITSSATSSSATKPAPRSDYAVWIGNLAFGTTPQRLQSWLEDKCVAGITRINMPKGARRHEQNKGFAYVDLPDETTLKYCISLSESPLEGRRLLIKDAKNFEGRPALSITAAAFSTEAAADAPADSSSGVALPPGAELLQKSANAALGKFAQHMLRSQKNAPSATLFVGNLPFAATAEGLREVLHIAEERKLESERERIEAKEMKEVRRLRREEKEKKREATLLAKAQGAAVPSDGAKAKVAEEDSSSDDDDDDDDDGDEEEDGAPETADGLEVADSDDSSDSDSDEDEANKKSTSADGAADTKGSKASGGKSKPQDPIGLVKIRLATFEDNPEKCKGFAFLDFASTLHATRVLINPRNRFYLARKLVYEYAGEEAQRRSGGKKRAAAAAAAAAGAGAEADGAEVDGYNEGRGGNSEWKRQRMAPGRGGSRVGRAGPRTSSHEARSFSDGDGPARASVGEGGDATTAASSKPTQAERAAARLAKGRGRASDSRLASGAAASSGGRREKPGAALANAARGKVGIVASEGKKITFE